MTAPAAQWAAPSSRTTAGSRETRSTGQLCALADGLGLRLSPAKLTKLVKAWTRTPEAWVVPFEQWVRDQVEERRIISYADPTGEIAARLVDRARGVARAA